MSGGSPTLTPREHALRVALLSALADEVKAALVQARAEAQQAFAPVRVDGQTQQLVMLPSGERVGLISIRDGGTTVGFSEDELLAWVAEHMPHEVKETVEPYAWDSLDLVALVKEHFPNVVKRGVRPSCRERLVAEMEANDGKVIDPATGEATKLGEVHRSKPTGAFSYRPDKGTPARIAAEWRAGHLDGIEVGPLARQAAIPAGGAPDAA
jgi:hypothetical protein